jgi:hypothetical protein
VQGGAARHPSGLALYFLAFKLEAFDGRGKGDYRASHDLEDLVAVIDGRPEVVDEVAGASEALRAFLAKRLHVLGAPELAVLAQPKLRKPPSESVSEEPRRGHLVEDPWEVPVVPVHSRPEKREAVQPILRSAHTRGVYQRTRRVAGGGGAIAARGSLRQPEAELGRLCPGRLQARPATQAQGTST